ncbi:MAG: hypothetical protein WA172_19990 [Terriglobales bacterium]
MATIKSTNKAEPNNPFSGTLLSSWSRQFWSCQQKIAMTMIASPAILGLLLAASACSKQSSKPAQAAVSGPESASSPITNMAEMPALAAANSTAEGPISPASAKTKVKKAAKKRPAAVVTYSDPNSGVSFMYPRKFALASGDEAQLQFAGMDAVPMNFVEPGGVTVATVALPNTLYPGTDFTTGFFTVNVNRTLAEQECPHFAFVDTSDADGEPIDAQKVKVGPGTRSNDGSSNEPQEMEMTSEFEGNATRQLETQYYHDYENGACYEYVLGLGTAGYGAREGIEPVNRDEVFAQLEKILATVKVKLVAHEHVAGQPAPEQPASEQTPGDAGSGK